MRREARFYQGQPGAPKLGWSFWDMFSEPSQETLPIQPYSSNYWNAGVNQSYAMPKHATRGPYRPWWEVFSMGAAPVGVEAFNRAQVQMDYGNTKAAQHELGDLFNDIMGAVVPGWDQRSDALKDIKIKADPAKILQAAQKIAPGAGGDAVRAANAAGLNVFVDTPGGPVLVTPEMAQGLYANYPMYTKARGLFDSVMNLGGIMSPTMLLAGGAVAFGLYLMMKR
ncbi:MAG: hypothetical protein ACRDL7_00055 [Gaiellaceae bacterium]